MTGNVVHFALQAEDIDRAKRFYEQVFNWRIEPWGPPGFFNITTGTEHERGIMGALEKRDVPLSGKGMRGCICTIDVDDVNATRALIEQHGGRTAFGPSAIPTVGTLLHFWDTEGNLLGAMQYDPAQRPTLRRS